MNYAIEKDVPIPPRLSGSGPGRGVPKGPFASALAVMEIGDSAFVADRTRNAINRAIVGATRGGKRYCSRKEGVGVRVWRIA